LKISDKVKEEFFNNILRTNGCWFWIGKKQHGRAYLLVDGKRISPRRISWQLAHPDEQFDENFILKTSCMEKDCVRDDHLYLSMRSYSNAT